MATTVFLLLLTTVAVARATRLVVVDKIFEPFRTWLVSKAGAEAWVTYLLHCPYCLSMWVAAVAVPIVWFTAGASDTLHLTAWVGIPVTWLAVSYGAALITKEANQ